MSSESLIVTFICYISIGTIRVFFGGPIHSNGEEYVKDFFLWPLDLVLCIGEGIFERIYKVFG